MEARSSLIVAVSSLIMSLSSRISLSLGSSRTVLLPAPVVDWRAGDCDLALDPAAPWDWVGFCDRLAPLLVLFADVGVFRSPAAALGCCCEVAPMAAWTSWRMMSRSPRSALSSSVMGDILYGPAQGQYQRGQKPV